MSEEYKGGEAQAEGEAVAAEAEASSEPEAEATAMKTGRRWFSRDLDGTGAIDWQKIAVAGAVAAVVIFGVVGFIGHARGRFGPGMGFRSGMMQRAYAQGDPRFSDGYCRRNPGDVERRGRAGDGRGMMYGREAYHGSVACRGAGRTAEPAGNVSAPAATAPDARTAALLDAKRAGLDKLVAGKALTGAEADLIYDNYKASLLGGTAQAGSWAGIAGTYAGRGCQPASGAVCNGSAGPGNGGYRRGPQAGGAGGCDGSWN